MPPITSRDFQKASAQRLNAAEALFLATLNLDAQYVGGYTIECSLKALILHLTPDQQRPQKLVGISSGAKMHDFEVLRGELGKLDRHLPDYIAKRLRRFKWTTDLRYETGRRNTGETMGFLKTARTVYDWVEKQLA